jgi:hypothetical protein
MFRRTKKVVDARTPPQIDIRKSLSERQYACFKGTTRILSEFPWLYAIKQEWQYEPISFDGYGVVIKREFSSRLKELLQVPVQNPEFEMWFHWVMLSSNDRTSFPYYEGIRKVEKDNGSASCFASQIVRANREIDLIAHLVVHHPQILTPIVIYDLGDNPQQYTAEIADIARLHELKHGLPRSTWVKIPYYPE